MAKRITELSQIKKPASDMFLPLDRVEAGGTGTYSSTVRNVIGSVIGQGAEPPSGGGSFQLTSTELLLSHSINIPPANTIEGGQCSMWFTDNEHVSVDAYNDVNGMYKREDGVSLGKNKKYLRTLARAATGDYYAAFLVSSSDGMLYKPLSLSEPTVLVPINTGNDSPSTGGVPVGVTMSYACEAEPTGWLICDGREVSRTQYADLFNCIGTKYGAGDNVSTFNIPNIHDLPGDTRQYVPVHSDANLSEIDNALFQIDSWVSPSRAEEPSTKKLFGENHHYVPQAAAQKLGWWSGRCPISLPAAIPTHATAIRLKVYMNANTQGNGGVIGYIGNRTDMQSLSQFPADLPAGDWDIQQYNRYKQLAAIQASPGSPGDVGGEDWNRNERCVVAFMDPTGSDDTPNEFEAETTIMHETVLEPGDRTIMASIYSETQHKRVDKPQSLHMRADLVGYYVDQPKLSSHIINTVPGGASPVSGDMNQLIQNAVSQQIQNMNITGGAHVSATPPSSVSKGMMWWDTNTATMYVYDGLTWVQANK